MERSVSGTTVILPSYDPGDKLPEVVAGLAGAGFNDIVIIDDGSREECQRFFNQAEEMQLTYPGVRCTILHHDVNRGKGRALSSPGMLLMYFITMKRCSLKSGSA